MVLKQKIDEMKQKEEDVQAEMEKLRSEIDERDAVIVEMKGRLECEQTD